MQFFITSLISPMINGSFICKIHNHTPGQFLNSEVCRKNIRAHRENFVFLFNIFVFYRVFHSYLINETSSLTHFTNHKSINIQKIKSQCMNIRILSGINSYRYEHVASL